MAITTREIPATLEQLWAVLADAQSYAEWVVGAHEIRQAEGDWPAKGSKFHHTAGVWPLHVRDNTLVLESEPPHRLVLQARVRPFGRARVELELSRSALGTQVVMTEEPTSPLLARLAKRLFDPLIHVRNIEALRRLENQVHQVTPAGE